jgi:hypothetical protein
METLFFSIRHPLYNNPGSKVKTRYREAPEGFFTRLTELPILPKIDFRVEEATAHLFNEPGTALSDRLKGGTWSLAKSYFPWSFWDLWP